VPEREKREEIGSKSSWLKKPNRNTVYACAYSNGNIYAAGHGGYTVVIAPNGQILAQYAQGTGDYETVAFSSDSGIIYTPLYAWSLSDDVSTAMYYVDPNDGATQTKDLDFVPLGG
jgi:hypothetical protein